MIDLRALNLDDLRPVSADEIPSVSGIYAYLSAAGEPLYVGRSVNMRRRLREHRREKKWASEIDSILIYELEGGADPLLVAETGLLLKYRPRYNRAIKLGITNDGRIFEVQFIRGRRGG